MLRVMRFTICCAIAFLFTFTSAAAQTRRILPVQEGTSSAIDTVPEVEIDPASLNRVMDIKKQFERQNSTYSVPVKLNTDLLRFLKTDEPQISPEALYWARFVRDASTVFDSHLTFRDTIIADPLFLEPVFRGKILPDDLKLYEDIGWKSSFKGSFAFMYEPDTTVFAAYYAEKKRVEDMEQYLETQNLSLFRFSESQLPGETIKTAVIHKPVYENLTLKAEPEIKNPDEIDAPAKFIPDRQYWVSAFESAIQFSQSYISKNWYNGGGSEDVNLNIFTRNYMRYDYKKDKIQFTNEAEIKASFYNAPNDTKRNYKVGDDLLRFHSNFGYLAFSKWYYTLDTEFKTQMFKNYRVNTKIKQAAFLSPFSLNLGIGMKYDLDKKLAGRNRNLKVSVNLAPASLTYMYSVKKDTLMDLSNYGFKKKDNPGVGENAYDNSLSRFGSTIRGDMTINFSRNISWQSRLSYFTTYENVVAEFENTLNLAISRYFSTRIYAYLRFDDSRIRTDPKDNSYFQFNQLLSFGFNYKW